MTVYIDIYVFPLVFFVSCWSLYGLRDMFWSISSTIQIFQTQSVSQTSHDWVVYDSWTRWSPGFCGVQSKDSLLCVPLHFVKHSDLKYSSLCDPRQPLETNTVTLRKRITSSYLTDQTTDFLLTRYSDGSPQSEGSLKNTEKKIRSGPKYSTAVMTLVLNTSDRLYDDFIHLLFLNTHRESTDLVRVCRSENY